MYPFRHGTILKVSIWHRYRKKTKQYPTYLNVIYCWKWICYDWILEKSYISHFSIQIFYSNAKTNVRLMQVKMSSNVFERKQTKQIKRNKAKEYKLN